MPLYEYQCLQCHKRTEKRQKFSDPEITACPHCGGPIERVISAPAISFKGGGWYADGYGNARPPNKSDASSDAAGKSDSASKSASDSGKSSDSTSSDSGKSDSKSDSSKSDSSKSESSKSDSGKSDNKSASTPAPTSTPAPAAAPSSTSSR